MSDKPLDQEPPISPFDPPDAGWTVRDDEPGLMTLVGPLWQHGEGESLRFGFVAEEKHLNRRGVVHGGMLMAFADQALGLTAREVNGGLPQATIQLDTQFIAPVGVGEFVEVAAQVVRRTRSILFMRGTLVVGERAVASAQGIWKVLGAG
ncbi:PaaI family thioesterase [Microvirga splendida]|uniref:PaaI family thioesterase n=1 Tax=Microvirga splendida TaxID=2795727 RepID=A0ABS0Y728_9HYPH|nr:PaaI family thioesterase [Microvirga splendida]MBJ6128091.1 PaaI family thioesterase [Microvirga splendida]